MSESLTGRFMQDGKESCNNTTCEQVMAIFERFYGTLKNPEIKHRFMKAKFERFRSTLDSQGIFCQEKMCLPLLQIISRLED